MLKKRAGNIQDIKAILDGHISKLFNALAKAKRAADIADKNKSDKSDQGSGPIWEAQVKAEKAVLLWAKNAVDGLSHMVLKADSIQNIKYSDVGLLFGTKSPEKVFELAQPVASAFSSMTKEEYTEALDSVASLFMERSQFSTAPGSRTVVGKISEMKSVISPTKKEPAPPKQKETITPTEQPAADIKPPDVVNNSEEAWYVSAELDPNNMFRQGSIFYGPFTSKITANVFSLLANNSSGSDRSVAQGARIAAINGLDFSLATSPASAVIGNRYLAGEIDSLMAAYQASKKKSNLMMANISPSGELFDYLVEFVSINCPFGDLNDPKVSEIVSWYKDQENGIAKFPEFYFFLKGNKATLSGSSKDLDPLDPAIHGDLGTEQGTKTKTKHKKDIKISNPHLVMPTGKAPDGLSDSIPLLISESISIFSEQDPERLSNELILKYIEELRTAAKGLDQIDMTQIANGLEQCVARLEEFFRSILYKDDEISRQISKFRTDNPLNIASISPTWEFNNNFSLANMLVKNKDIINSLSGFIGKIIFQKRQISKPSITDIIGIRIAKFQNIRGMERITPEEKEEIVSGIVTVIINDLIAQSPGVITEKLTKDFSQSIRSGSATNDLVEKIVRGINIDALADGRIKAYFSSKSEVASVQSISMIKCGVCDQVFSVPEQHIAELKKFNKNTKNYSFFREDNSLITEDELIGDMANQKIYTIDDATAKLLVDDATGIDAMGVRKARRRRGGKEVEVQKQDVKRSFTWLEANRMIYFPTGIKDQIDGQIIRNYILASLGGTATGQRGMLTNKTLCAASLYNISSEMVKSNTGLVSGNDNYACRASIMASYDAVPKAKNYQASSYIMPFGNSTRNASIEKYPNRLGYMFSRNNVRCPCLIDSKSNVLEESLKTGKKSYVNMINFIAVPKLPQSALGMLHESLMFKESDLYSAPTNPSGGQDKGLPAAYVVCGRNTSLSMFDRDPSSPNYIQTFFKNLLSSSGKDALVGAIKLMLSYGIEMNDIKPHIETVLGEQDITATSKKEILQALIKKSRRVIAQESAAVDIGILGGLGMVCEHGHKFTLRQSWDFAKSHFAIKLVNDTLVNSKELKAMIDDPFKAMIDSKTVGIFNISVDEEALRSNGFKQPAEVESLAELKQLMADKHLYFKSDDGVLYTIKDPRFGSLDDAPWLSNKVLIQKQFPGIFKRFVTTDTMTQDGEEDGSGPSQGDIADTSILSAEDKLTQDRAAAQDADLNFADIIMPDMPESISASIASNAKEAFSSGEIRFKSDAKDFIDNLIKTLKLSRSWGVMAADYQIDFMRGGNPELIRDPDLKNNIAAALDPLSAMVGLQTLDYEADFYAKYDVDSLISESFEIAHDKFLSLATFAQYYEGFSVPFIANMKPLDARAALIAALKAALIGSLPMMLYTISRKNLDVTLPALGIAAETIATLLLSQYDNLFTSKSGYNYLMEKAIVDYTARAYTFSFSLDMVDKLNTFLSRYFFNEESSLYIGPFSGADRSAMDILDGMLRVEQTGEGLASNMLLMDEKDFTSRILQLRSAMGQLYNFDALFRSYMNHKKIVISNDSNQLMAQKAVVAMRFSTLLAAASNSIGSIVRGLSEKPLNSPSMRDAAKILDSTTDSLIRRRDPVNYETLKKRGNATLDKFEDRDHIFEQNAAGFARINLSPMNVSLAPIAYLDKNIREVSVRPAAIDESYFYIESVMRSKDKNPFVYLIKKIIIAKQSGAGQWAAGRAEGNKEFYICIVPATQGGISSIDLMNYLQFDNSSVINLDSKQGREFVERYVRGIDLSQSIVLMDPDLLDLKPKASKTSAKDLIQLSFDTAPKIGKIYDPMMSWPPPNNLLYNNYDIARNPSTEMVSWRGFNSNLQHITTVDAANKRYASSSNIENHTDFMASLTRFPESIGSKTADVSSTHGVLIPLKLENPKLLRSFADLDNTIWRDETDVRQDSLFISKANLRVRTDSGDVLDMLWAFKALDTQFYDENGQVKNRLVQSGAVQKLEYIKLQLSQIYNWIASNAKMAVEELLDQSFSSLEEFLSEFFSIRSQCVRITTDISKSLKVALLITSADMIKTVLILREDVSPVSVNTQINELTTNLVRLVDLYNASQVLNLECSKLRPQLNTVNSIDLSTREESKSLSLKLLDPFSLWKMITNPAMSSDFGGPINPANIEDYKALVVSAFGINDLLGKVCDETTLSTNDISTEDLFDMPGFCARYISKRGKDSAITKFIAMFSLQAADDGSVKTYVNGYPMIFEHSGKLEAIMASLESKQFELHESSYVEHICRTRSMFESMTAKDMKDPAKLRALKDRIIALQNGTESTSIDELVSLVNDLKLGAKRYSAGGKDPSARRAGDMEALRIALLDVANKAYYGVARPLARKAQISLSWRKIAQGADDDDSSIELRGLYDGLQQQILNIMALMAG